MMRKHLLSLIILLVFPYSLFSSIAQGTLVKTSAGFTAVEQLTVGDIVLSHKDGNLLENRITHIASAKICPSYKISAGETSFYASANQLIFDPHLQDWIAAESLNAESQILSLISGNQTCSISSYEGSNGYDLSLEAPHNFLITKQEILVHNVFPAIALVPLIAAEGAATAKGIACGIALLGAHLLHKRLAQAQWKQRETNHTPNSSPPINPEDPEWKKKHPHGRYEDAGYHHPNSKGIKNPPPKNGQRALDNSHKIEKVNSPHRISIDDGEFVVLKQTSPGLFHGYTCSWAELTSYMQNTLRNAKLVTPKGKILP